MSVKVLSRFGSHVKEIRLHLCLTSDSSSGVRDFVAKHYQRVKQTNPNLPLLVREGKGIEPKLWARFEYGRESNASLSGLNGDQVLQQIQEMVKTK